MTGNTVLLGIALAAGEWTGAVQSAVIIAAFLVGVAASAWLRRWLSLAAILVIEMTAIVVAALVTPMVAAPVLAFAMGLQNAAMTHFAGTTLNTVFLTGNLQKLVQSLLRRGQRDPSEVAAVTVANRLWIAYLAGVVLGCDGVAMGDLSAAVCRAASADCAAAPLGLAHRLAPKQPGVGRHRIGRKLSTAVLLEPLGDERLEQVGEVARR